LRGEGASHCKVWGHSAVTCTKTAEPTKFVSSDGPARGIVLDGVQIPHG